MNAHPSTELQPIVQTPKPGENPVSVHLKIEDSQDGLVATISRRDGIGKVIGQTQGVSRRDQGGRNAASEDPDTVTRLERLRLR